MKVYKFGGASISSLERIQNTAKIIRENSQEKTLIIISAMGKVTNALEKVTETFYNGNQAEALRLFEKTKESHLGLSKYLVTLQWQQTENQLKEFFTEVEWMLHDKPVRSYDYYYDQVVCCGELLSSSLVSNHLLEEGVHNVWVDVRDILRTDDNFRDAKVDWDFTTRQVKEKLLPLFEKTNLVILQGFIGATDENESTTLGREGSDYTASIFANILDANEVVIWKDVDAVMSADPKENPAAEKIAQLSYTEVIEMAYYGAQVIHPKTIKPLQNKNIPLYVKSFLHPDLPGTVINNQLSKNLPAVTVIKKDQVLIQFKSRNFEFVSGKPVEQLKELMNHLKLSSNLEQHTAISLLCCFDESEKLSLLAANAAEIFDVEMEKNLTLLTIRHYNEDSINGLVQNKTVVLEQKTLTTVQLLVRNLS